jgi:hypothetical protein
MSKKRRKLSRKVYEHANKTKNKGGTSRQTYIDWEKLKKGDEKIEFFKSTKGTHRVNVIPFIVKSKLNPLVKQGIIELDNDESDYMLDVFVHPRMGPNEVDVLCPKENYGKRCPGCEGSHKYFSEGKIEEGKALKAKRRVIMNIQPLIRDENDELKAQKLQVFEVSHWLFAKKLTNEANACEDGNDVIFFADTEDGKIVKFRVEMDKWKGKDVPKYESFSFLDRREEIDDEVLDQAISFDEGLILLSYEEIEKIMYGQDEDEEDEAPEKDKNKDEKDEDGVPEKKDEEEKDDKPSKEKCPKGHKWGEAGKHGKDCKKCDEKRWDDCCEAGSKE